MTASTNSLDWRTILMLSRPGLWFLTVWLYLWPTGGHWYVFKTFPFYVGLLLSTLPFNLLMFGMNDMVDFDVDQLHVRKGNYTWGARASKSELGQLPPLMAFSVLCPVIIIIAATGRVRSAIWVLGFFLSNILYNVPPAFLSRKGPWEIPCMVLGLSCITMFACEVNNVPSPSIGGWMFHWLAIARGQLYGEVIDIDDDAQVGKNTTAVKFGKLRAQQLMLALTVCEILVCYAQLASVYLTTYYVLDVLVQVCSASKRWGRIQEYKLAIFRVQTILRVVYLFYAWPNRVLA
ncbi:hypothetical protein FOZ63_001283 [Perkinsus olseni]|uniref:UbiA prenyltransferase domain-containing protein 1 n=1 Tax=Perkinsus olseni TaxID=32597 RepID=A0A7J6R757_PEROL|nr:hypothetical protein FOZ63_001283 [Perkinsus olseni]